MDTFASLLIHLKYPWILSLRYLSIKSIHGYCWFVKRSFVSVRPQRPIFLLSCRGQKYIQQHQNVLPIRSMRRGGFRFEEKILNPNEKSLQCCGWAVQAFTKPGMFKSLSFIFACRWLCLVAMCRERVNARGLSSIRSFLFGHRGWRYVILK